MSSLLNRQENTARHIDKKIAANKASGMKISIYKKQRKATKSLDDISKQLKTLIFGSGEGETETPGPGGGGGGGGTTGGGGGGNSGHPDVDTTTTVPDGKPGGPVSIPTQEGDVTGSGPSGGRFNQLSSISGVE